MSSCCLCKCNDKSVNHLLNSLLSCLRVVVFGFLSDISSIRLLVEKSRLLVGIVILSRNLGERWDPCPPFWLGAFGKKSRKGSLASVLHKGWFFYRKCVPWWTLLAK